MNHDIATQLKALKRIAPHPAYVTRSRATLLAAVNPPLSPWHSFQWAGALAFAMALLFVATFSLPAKPTLSASLNENLLSGELNDLSINIELQELTYRAATERALASAITEIGETEASHLNTEILSSELSSLQTESTSSEIDALLERVLE
ncbi:MAG: hypothetical protein V1885_02600 [Candidatus Brennerbacteria bacterium]